MMHSCGHLLGEEVGCRSLRKAGQELNWFVRLWVSPMAAVGGVSTSGGCMLASTLAQQERQAAC